MKTPYLSSENWLAAVKEKLASEPLESFRVSQSEFLVPLEYIGFHDIEDEIFDEKPYSTEVVDLGERGLDYDTGDFDFVRCFIEDVLPELEGIAKICNTKLGGNEYFLVEKDPKEAAASVEFFFEQEDIGTLTKYGIISEYPALAAVLASRPAFSDFEGPLFEGADVEVQMKENPEERLLPDPTTAKLILPNLSAGEAERVQPNFQITVSKRFEDDRALVKTYAFTFAVRDVTFEPLANGQVRPKFKAELKEYKNA